MDNKKNILYIIFILIFSIGLVILTNSISENISEKKSSEYDVTLSNFQVIKSTNQLNIKFDILNKENKKIFNKKIYINFYDHNKLLYTYDYEIENLNDNNIYTIEAICDFEFNDITKYEYVFDNQKVELNPIFIKGEEETNLEQQEIIEE